jgi:hypothetical protein
MAGKRRPFIDLSQEWMLIKSVQRPGRDKKSRQKDQGMALSIGDLSVEGEFGGRTGQDPDPKKQSA